MFAETHDLYDSFTERLLGLVLTTITVSIVVQGLSVTPVMKWCSPPRQGGGDQAVAAG